MSTRERLHTLIDEMPAAQLEAWLVILEASRRPVIQEEAPDEWDKTMIADSRTDNEESMPLDAFAKSLGFR